MTRNVVASCVCVCLLIALSCQTNQRNQNQTSQSRIDRAKQLTDRMIAVVESRTISSRSDWEVVNGELTSLSDDEVFRQLSESETQELDAYSKSAASRMKISPTDIAKAIKAVIVVPPESNCPNEHKCTQCIGIHQRCCYKNVGNGLCAGAWSCPASPGQQCNWSDSCYCP